MITHCHDLGYETTVWGASPVVPGLKIPVPFPGILGAFVGV
jgi:hypothetical protein